MQLPVQAQYSGDLTSALAKITFRLLPYMFLLYIVSYLDRINISYAALQMNADLHFSDEVFGLGAGVFFLGYCLFGVPSNLMVQKLGARKWISTIMVIWGCVSMSMSLVSSLAMFYALRFALGVAEAGFFPGMILYLTYWFPKREHGSAVARFMTAVPVAGFLGGLVAAKALSMTGVLGLPGWKWLFIMTGSCSVALGILTRCILSDGPDAATWLSASEKLALSDKLAQEQEQQSTTIAKGTSALLNAKVWLFALIYFCFTVGMYGFQFWLPQIIKSHGQLTNQDVALISIIPTIFQGLGMNIVGASSDRTNERRLHVLISGIVAAAGLIICAYSHDLVMSVVGLSIAAFGIWGSVGPFWSLPTAALTGTGVAAGIALINSVGNLGGFAGPYMIGWVKSHSATFSLALAAMSAPLLLGGLLASIAPQGETK